MKQPHEDVPRPYGDDPLLSLDESAWPFRDALTSMAGNLHDATMVFNPAPIVERMYERLSNPRPGDMVLELSSRFPSRDRDTRNKGFGRLVLVREEWWETDEEWRALLADEDSGLTEEDRSKDTAWYVQYGPDHICRWTNCMFMVVPVNMPRKAYDRD